MTMDAETEARVKEIVAEHEAGASTRLPREKYLMRLIVALDKELKETEEALESWRDSPR